MKDDYELQPTHSRGDAPAGRRTHHVAPALAPARSRQAHRPLRRRFQSRLAAVSPRRVVRFARHARWLSLALLLVGAALLIWFGLDDMFYVAQLTVEGNTLVPAEEIGKASGARNYNVFFLKFGEIERDVADLPGVKDATAWYVFPNTVHISVSERTAAFAWESGKRVAWVDDSGAVYAIGKPSAELPIVRDTDNKTRAHIDPAIVAAVKTIGAALPSVKRLDYSDTRGLSFNDEHGWKILFGQAEQVNAKLAMLQALSGHLLAQKIEPEYVDVRLPDRAFYKPR